MTHNWYTKVSASNVKVKSIVEGFFRRVVCDEAHSIKNITTRSSLAVQALRCNTHILLTATPMINSSSDWLGLLQLLQPTAHPKIDDWKRCKSTEQLLTYLETLFNDESEIYGEVVNPELFVHLHNNGTSSPLFASFYLPLLYRTILLRREPGEEMLKDASTGETLTVCGNLPTLTLAEIHCRGSKHERAAYAKLYERSRKLLVKKSFDGDGDARGGINMAVMRKLACATAGRLVNNMASRSVEAGKISELKVLGARSDLGIRLLLLTDQDNRRCALPIATSLTAPENIMSLIEYMVLSSVKSAALFGIMAYHVKRNEKVLIATDWPISTWAFGLLIHLAGISVEWITSDMSIAKRNEICDSFNSTAQNSVSQISRCDLQMTCTGTQQM